MPTIARLIGGAGTGKTTRLLDTMAKVIEAGEIGPEQIGFVSFTRAARQVAAERAADKFGVSVGDLTDRGWFRTLHSVCYRCLEAGKDLLADTKADREWVAAAVGDDAGRGGANGDGLDDDGAPFASATDAGRALGLWEASRARLEPLAATWERAAASGYVLPLDEVAAVVSRYETAKAVHHRIDFTDLLGAFAGYRFRVDGPERVAPRGYVPALDVWFLDEQQDTSRLLDAVCHRLIEPARWVYVVGDPFQSIYGWAGADGGLFMDWQAARQEIMPKSYRCPAPILEMGEAFLRRASDYWDRGIAPADHEGDVTVAPWHEGLLSGLDPRESWLLIARSNWHANRLARVVDRLGVPWAPTRGNGGWHAPVRNAGLTTLAALGRGEPIDGEQWKQALKLIPSIAAGEPLLIRGTKTRFEEMRKAAEQHPWVQIEHLSEVGATERLIQMFRNGSWVHVVEGAARFVDAVGRWGEDAVLDPGIRVGTIHSVKGAEADNVLWLTTTSEQVAASAETPEGANEESRVNYVAATRARRRLILAHERTRYQTELP